MKTFYIPLALLAALLLFSVITGSYVQQCTQEWTALLDQCDDFLREEQWERTENLLQETYRSWEKHTAIFHMILEHQDLDTAEQFFAGAFAACRQRSSTELQIYLYQLNSQFRFLAETQKADLKNIL